MKLPIGMHSINEILKNIIINGVKFPPPPKPPALLKITIIIIRKTPTISTVFGGIGKSVNFIA
jgi:hypothetical protein